MVATHADEYPQMCAVDQHWILEERRQSRADEVVAAAGEEPAESAVGRNSGKNSQRQLSRNGEE